MREEDSGRAGEGRAGEGGGAWGWSGGRVRGKGMEKHWGKILKWQISPPAWPSAHRRSTSPRAPHFLCDLFPPRAGAAIYPAARPARSRPARADFSPVPSPSNRAPPAFCTAPAPTCFSTTRLARSTRRTPSRPGSTTRASVQSTPGSRTRGARSTSSSMTSRCARPERE